MIIKTEFLFRGNKKIKFTRLGYAKYQKCFLSSPHQIHLSFYSPFTNCTPPDTKIIFLYYQLTCIFIFGINC